jgi:hypothetical protein
VRQIDTGPWEAFAFGTNYDRRQFAITPDGRHLLGLNESTWRIKLVDLQTGKHVADFGEAGEAFHGLTVSPDGQHVVVRHYQTLDLFDLPRRKYLRSLDEDVVVDGYSAASFLTPRLLSLISRDALCVWDIETGEELMTYELPPKDRVDIVTPQLAGAPGGVVVATIVDHRILLIEVATGQLRAELARLPHDVRTRRHKHAASCLAFSPNGRILAVGCADAIRLYDVVTGQELPPLTAHLGGIWALHFTPDGQSLLSLGKDDKLLTWTMAEIIKPLQNAADSLKFDDAQHDDSVELDKAIEAIDLDDAWRTYAAMSVVTNSGWAVPSLRERLKAVRPLSESRVQELVAGLSDKDINKRKATARQIGNAIDQVYAGLGERSQMQHRLQWRLPTEAQLREVQLVWLLADLRYPDESAKEFLTQLSAGYEKAPLTIAAKGALQRLATEKTTFTTWKELQPALTDRDARRGFASMRHIVTHWGAMRQPVREQLAALEAAPDLGNDPAAIRKWIEQLDAEDFRDRELASEHLSHLGRGIEPQLKAALADSPSVEVKKRLEAIIPKLTRRSASDTEVLARRLIEAAILEGSPESQAMLQDVSGKTKRKWLQTLIAEMRVQAPVALEP